MRFPPARARVRDAAEDNKNDVYDFYPSRDLIEAEFDAIWEAQAPHHLDLLTPEVHDRLYEIIFYQRPLKAPKIGLCTLVDGETRLAKAHPLFQQRRLLEEINALQLIRTGEAPRRLMPDERDLILLKFQGKASLSFDNLRKGLKLDSTVRFNKESENRPKLLGDEVAARMADKKRFGPHWRGLSPDEQWEVIRRRQNLESDADEAAFLAWLGTTHRLSPERAAAVATVELPIGFGRIGLTATTKLIAALTDGRTDAGEVLVYSEAVVAAGLGHHSDRRTGEVHQDDKGNPILPYYGLPLERHLLPGTGDPGDPVDMRVGRLTNPTVHIGLNQLARVMNALIRRFGRPTEIAMELARDLNLSDEEKQKRNKENNHNRQEAEKRSEKLRAIGQPDTGENRARLKLWEELGDDCLNRRCVYSGEQIGIEKLFSDAVEIDHILPFSVTLDDSNANKIVCMRHANREKGNRTPHGALGP
jgi:CRISPR-associated endonuclease Csn1